MGAPIIHSETRTRLLAGTGTELDFGRCVRGAGNELSWVVVLGKVLWDLEGAATIFFGRWLWDYRPYCFVSETFGPLFRAFMWFASTSS